MLFYTELTLLQYSYLLNVSGILYIILLWTSVSFECFVYPVILHDVYCVLALISLCCVKPTACSDIY